MRLVLTFWLVVMALALPAAAEELAVISTDHGEIRIALHADKAPQTVENFIKLAREGFYDGLTFHRVVPGFVVQGGDPLGNGTGGPGYDIPAEIHPDLKHLTGTLATARKGDRVNPERRSSGSQFYICLAPQPQLDGDYTIFGQVVAGMEVVEKIQVGDRMNQVRIEGGP
ncbi:peptidylprolyl isomerase [Geoalkalibacter halelectricus]|uniref:Peptidyl-prolyl cis-trans isomerase n=1 Tax=Geoalkalibacter halelectricus TaxID=2847045 RepID=A0ABY5ZJY1_9BACT|nr:peptidylprolyl isomerase [Geoalkalibacter halelectricus]MDO3378206.1 peptidylprolyl isomerase [Geoalkalibacter halelectricus]UWZ78049.1 peptidylprolyl isomerase [Geoalkalibacter halelectricus]